MSIIKYPLELNQNNVDYVVFSSYKYRTNQRVIGSDVSGPGGGPPSEGNVIQLFMPTSTPAVANSNSWGPEGFEGPMGALKRDLMVGATGIINNVGTSAANSTISNIAAQFEGLKNGIGDVAKQAAVNFVGNIGGRAPNTLLALNRGQIYNPNVELIYQGPQLREFGFNYIFMPKSAKEAEIVNSILLEFKKWAAPKEAGGMFEIPAVWQVTYMTGGVRNKNMNEFKRAALTSVSSQANSGLDMHMSYRDGVPISTTLSLQFTEVDIITRDDHLKSKSNQGY